MKRTLCLLLTLVSVLLVPAVATAEMIPGLTSFSGGTPFAVYSTNETLGWRFQVTADGILVTHLGLWDQLPNDPLLEPHLVGLWTDGGVLLGQVTVQVNSPLTDSFRYETLDSAITLNAGAFYRIGAQFNGSGVNDMYISSATSVAMAPEFTFDRAYNSPNGTGFAFPGEIPGTGGPLGRFGPNFLFTPDPIPEPSSVILLGLGLSALVYRRLRPA